MTNHVPAAVSLKRKVSILAVGTALAGSLLLAAPVLAHDGGNDGGDSGDVSAHVSGGFHFGLGRRAFVRGLGEIGLQAVLGKVTVISGSTLTVEGKTWSKDGNAPQTYSINASSATFLAAGSAATLADIKVGDTVVAYGTFDGTTLAASKVNDLGTAPAKGGKNGKDEGSDEDGDAAQSGTPGIQGTGEPVVGGTVTAVSGTNVTFKNGSATYVADVSHATIVRRGTSAPTVSDVAVGDRVIVQGAVSGTSISATSLIDQPAPKAPSDTTGGSHGDGEGHGDHGGGNGGFFAAIKGFFRSMFGFF